MTTYTLTHASQLVTEECYKCGITFAMPAQFKRDRLDDHASFYCPNGHGQQYIGKTDAQKLKEARERLDQAHASLRANRDQLQASERSKAALKGVVTRTKRRIANGVCPCCSRTFKNLASHMEGQHPDYVSEANT